MFGVVGCERLFAICALRVIAMLCSLCCRLLSWAGRGIEPVGVDYVLQKLGFSHARTTIPKWIQRGIMDPCDLMCASLSTSLIEYMTAKTRREEEDGDRVA